MAATITGVKRDGSVNLTVESQEGLVLGFIEYYHVITDDPKMLQWEVMRDAIPDEDTAPQLPVNGLPLPGHTVALDGFSVCKNLSGERDERNPLKWTFTAEWSSKVEGQGASGNNSADSNPETAISFRETLFEVVQRPRRKDLLGHTYANGAGDLFTPPLVVDEENARWDFKQVEPFVDPRVNLPNGFTLKTEPFLMTVTVPPSDPVPMPPGIYRVAASGLHTIVGFTDDTIAYMNGSINWNPVFNNAVYTLLLKVRSSKIFYINGTLRRLTEYTIIRDKKYHFDKPLNIGPYFLAPELDANGNPLATFVKYPYVYFTKDVEDHDTEIVVQQDGPLGDRNLLLSKNPGATSLDNILERAPAAVEDGEPQGGSKLVTAANGTKTYRANRLPVGTEYFHIEFLNHELLDFGRFLRLY